MTTIYSDGAIYLFGAVGSDFPDEPGFSADDVRQALAEHGTGSVTVHINSGGGYASEGAAIHALLSRHSGGVDVVIDGIAASAASLIAMAGRTVAMAMGAVMMIHDPAAATIGDSNAHRQSIAGLEALATSYASIYAAKSGKSAAACRKLMQEETWFTPEQAVAAGFADRVGTGRAVAMAPFPYEKYRRAKMYMRNEPRARDPNAPLSQAEARAIMQAAVAETNARQLGLSREEAAKRYGAQARKPSSLAAVVDKLRGMRPAIESRRSLGFSLA